MALTIVKIFFMTCVIKCSNQKGFYNCTYFVRKKIECASCEFIFTSNSKLNRHFNLVHLGKNILNGKISRKIKTQKSKLKDLSKSSYFSEVLHRT